jgi:hypothetical protein
MVNPCHRDKCNRCKKCEQDPVYHCEVYNEIGCSNIDGLLCDMSICRVLKDYRKKDFINTYKERLNMELS